MDSDSEEVFLISIGLLYLRLKKKKNRRMWVHPIVKERHNKSMYYNLFKTTLQDDEEKFFNFVRMSKNSFNELLRYIESDLTKQNTVMRESFSPEEKLVVTLR